MMIREPVNYRINPLEYFEVPTIEDEGFKGDDNPTDPQGDLDHPGMVKKYNPNHYPAGSARGGQFAPSKGGKATATGSSGVIIPIYPGAVSSRNPKGGFYNPPIKDPDAVKLAEGLTKIIDKNSRLIYDVTGLRGISVSPIGGTAHGTEAPSLKIDGKDATPEQLDRVAKLLGGVMGSDMVMTVRADPNLDQGVPGYFASKSKGMLSAAEVSTIHELSVKHGLDYQLTSSGRGVQWIHNSDYGTFKEFVDKTQAITREAGLNKGGVFLSEVKVYGTSDLYEGANRGDKWYGDPSSSPRSIRRRVEDNLIIPLQRVFGEQGFRLDHGELGKRLGYSEEQIQSLKERSYPKTPNGNSTRAIMEGYEKLEVERNPTVNRITTGAVSFALQNRAASLGGVIDPKDYSKKAADIVSSGMADEVSYYIKTPKGKDALGWYAANLDKARKTYAKEFPEILHDHDASFKFNAILGITSQEATVQANAKGTLAIYGALRKGATMAEAIKGVKIGKSDISIKDNLLKLESLLKTHDSRQLEGILSQKKTIAEWDSYFKENPELGFTSGKMSGLKSEVVTGWTVFGPKIGSFMNNLNGDYDTLTADRWFQRTYNRHLGNSFNTETVANERIGDSLKEAMLAERNGTVLKEVSTRTTGKTTVIKGYKKWVHGDSVTGMSDEEFERTLNDPEALRDFAYKTTLKFREGFKDRTSVKAAAQNFVERYEEIVVPRTSKERSFQNSLMKMVSEKVFQQTGIRLKAADIQAALWYYEKELYSKLGVTDKRSAPADYFTAAEEALSSFRSSR